MNCFRRNYLLLALLVLLFAAPGITAYYFYIHNTWLASDTTNKGFLLNPPILITPPLDNSKWMLVLWSPEDCEKTCIQQLDKLARIRLALGRRLYNVDITLLLGPTATPITDSLRAMLNEQDINVIQQSVNGSNELQKLPDYAEDFIMNPQHFLILKYSLHAPSEDIFHDIKHLLKTKE